MKVDKFSSLEIKLNEIDFPF